MQQNEQTYAVCIWQVCIYIYICIFIDVCTYIDIHTSMIDMYAETMGVNFQNWFKGILQETRIFEGTVY